jgi:hypothetical protein
LAERDLEKKIDYGSMRKKYFFRDIFADEEILFDKNFQVQTILDQEVRQLN